MCEKDQEIKRLSLALAERDALLLDALDNGELGRDDVYEAIHDYLEEHAALSGSAEPSAPYQEIKTFSYFVAQGEERAACPFCGGKVRAPVRVPAGHDDAFTITCNCGCKYGPDFTEEACERGWNRRAIEPEQKKVAMLWLDALQQCAELLGMQCGDDLAAVPKALKSALVIAQRDERAEFVEAWNKRGIDPVEAILIPSLTDDSFANVRARDAYWGWKARAALERKPS